MLKTKHHIRIMIIRYQLWRAGNQKNIGTTFIPKLVLASDASEQDSIDRLESI